MPEQPMPSGVPILQVQVVPHAKPWWASRTLIVNAVMLVLLMAESRLQLLQGLLPVDVYTAAAFALPIVNAALRLITTTSIALPQIGHPASAPPTKDAA